MKAFRYGLLIFELLAFSGVFAFQDVLSRVGSIQFEGNGSVSAAQLKSAMRHCAVGREFSDAALNADLRQIEKIYRDLGFIKVQLPAADIRSRPVEKENAVSIRIVIKEGPRYVAGKVAIKGAVALDPETLMQICPVQKNQPYSSEKAAQWQFKVEDAYRAMGYVKVQCPIRETVNESGRTVDCTMTCVEGRVYSVGKINILGGGSINPLDVKKRLLFSEGGLYNPEMLSLSIQYLNQMRLYSPISFSDINLSYDDENGIVNVTLRVVPRAQ